jgi:hypothetical protein
LQYMRDGVVAVAQPGAHPSVSLLRALQREFGFYCIEMMAEQAAVPERLEVTYVMGGRDNGGTLLSMERYDASAEQWSAVAAMGTARIFCGACVVAGELYVSGVADEINFLSTVEKYSPSSDTWSAVAPLPTACSNHAAVAVGSDMYVLGGSAGAAGPIMASVLKLDITQGTWSHVAPMPTVSLRCVCHRE